MAKVKTVTSVKGIPRKQIDAIFSSVQLKQGSEYTKHVRNQMVSTAQAHYVAMLRGVRDVVNKSLVKARIESYSERGSTWTGQRTANSKDGRSRTYRSTTRAPFQAAYTISQPVTATQVGGQVGSGGSITHTRGTGWKMLRYDYGHKAPTSTRFWAKHSKVAKLRALDEALRKAGQSGGYFAGTGFPKVTQGQRTTHFKFGIGFPALPGNLDVIRQTFVTGKQIDIPVSSLDRNKPVDRILFPEATYRFGRARPMLQPWAIDVGKKMDDALRRQFRVGGGRGGPSSGGSTTRSDVIRQELAITRAVREHETKEQRALRRDEQRRQNLDQAFSGSAANAFLFGSKADRLASKTTKFDGDLKGLLDIE